MLGVVTNIILSTLGVIILISSLLVLYFLYRKSFLLYDKYNKLVNYYAKTYSLDLDKKLIKFKFLENTSPLDINKNIQSLTIINIAIADLFKFKTMEPQLDEEHFINLLNSLPDLPSLIDLSAFIDNSPLMMIKELFRLSARHSFKRVGDSFLLKVFGNHSSYSFKNKEALFIYNQKVLKVSFNQRIITPTLIDFGAISPSLSVKKRWPHRLNLSIAYDNISLVKYRKWILIKDIPYYQNLISILNYYDIYKNCLSIKDALNKQQHIKKICIETDKKINKMSGIKFMKWIQLAFKSIYGVDIIHKLDNKYGNYLLINKLDSKTRVVVQVKRHNDPITSTVVKDLKDIQSREKAQEAWLVTNYTFTKIAISLAKETSIKLIDKRDLLDIIEKYTNKYYKQF